MPLDHYISLGRSGLRVSPFCLGAMTFGEDLGWGSSVEESEQIVDRFIELGGNFIDTANFYTRGHFEKIIGDHLGRHPLPARSMAALEDLVRTGKVRYLGVSDTPAWKIAQARSRLAQLEDNVKALDVELSSEELAQLDTLTKAVAGFPQSMQPMFATIHNGGTTVNGTAAPPSPFGVEKGDKVY